MKLHCFIIYSVLLITYSVQRVAAQDKSAVKCIVIDAGHGGKDPGAVNGKVQEKSITLSVALKLGAIIKQNYPGIKVLYTRKDDTFVPLHERSKFANRNNADIFISIHTNAAKNTAASGTETFLMGVDKSGDNLAVAMRENDVITYEADYSTRYEGFEPGSAESFIIFSLMNYSHQSRSLELASLIQKEYAANLPMKNRGVKQAGYLVLWQAIMPSILTEIGFISNAEECKLLVSDSGQDKIATQILRALKTYIAKNGGEKPLVVSDKGHNINDKKDDIEISNNNPKPSTDGICFRLLATSSQSKIEITSQKFGQYVTVVEEVKWGNLYKYYIETMFSYKEALLLQQKLSKMFPSSSIEAFQDGERIKVEDAKKIKP